MALRMDLLLLVVIISTKSPIAAASNSLHCDATYEVELKESLTLQCSISGEHRSIYWFRGTDTSAVPFIWVEDDVGGEGLGEYNITDGGALVINSASLHHEGNYTTLVYFQDGSHKTAETKVMVTIAPNPRCPTLDTLCNTPCPSSCSFNVSGDGEILCSINGSRPKTAIAWKITGQSGISFIKHKPEFAYNADSDTWNTTLGLGYKLDAGAGGATIQCAAPEKNDWDTSVTTVKLYYDIGRDGPTASPTPQGADNRLAVIIIVVVAVVVILVICSVVCWRYQRSRYQELEATTGDEETAEVMVPFQMQMQLRSSQSPEDRRLLLVSLLREHYGKECFIKPLPWDEPVPISSFYIPCNYEVDLRQSTTKIVSSLPQANTEELFSGEFQFDNNRVLIIADLGYGKTTFTKHVVDRWRAGGDERNTTILINVFLKEVNKNTRLAECVFHMLPPETTLNAEVIEDILRENACHVLLDGLDELSMSMSNPPRDVEKNAKPDVSRESEKVKLTIGHLLTGNIPRSYKEINVWVTSRIVDDTNSHFELPYAKVTLSGFSETQLNKYITKVCEHYSEQRRSKPVDPTPVVGMEEDEDKHFHTEELTERVKETLEYNEISEEFATTPLLLIMIIHIIASKIMDPEGRMKTVELNKLTTIVQMVITCLESRYIQKIHERKNVPKQVKSLEEKLGRLAVRRRLEDAYVGIGDISKEDIDIALAVGLLRLTKEVAGNSDNLAFSSFSGVKFYHQYFQEYLAAKYARFNDEEIAMKKIVKSRGDDQTIRLLQFMAGSYHPQLRGVLKILFTTHEMLNNFIDCIYEIEGNTKQEEMIKHFKKDIETRIGRGLPNVRYLDKQYHREAVSTYFALCKRTNIKTPIVIFSEEAAIDVLKHLALPIIDDLRFYKLNIGEDNFVRIIEHISRKDNIPTDIQFISCVVPEKLSDGAKMRIQSACKQTKLRITKQNREGTLGDAAETFNLNTFKWRGITGRTVDGVRQLLPGDSNKDKSSPTDQTTNARSPEERLN